MMRLGSCRSLQWALAGLLAAPAVPALASDGGGVVGWVESTHGAPLAGAVVSIFGKGIRGSRVTLSDSRGQFMMPALPPGSYTLRAVSAGHQPSPAQHITVLPNREALFTLSLEPAGEPAIASADGEPAKEGALREWLWLLRHKPRSVLETAGHEQDDRSGSVVGLSLRQSPDIGALAALGPLAAELELAASSGSGQATPSDGGLGAVRLQGRFSDGLRWSLGGLVAENEGRAWRMAAQFVINPGGSHEIETGAGYGGDDTRGPLTEGPLQPARTTGAAFVRDRWRVSRQLTATAGARYTYIGFLPDSHHADAVVQIELASAPGSVVRGSIAARSLAPGGDLLTLSTVTASPAISTARLDDGLRTAQALRCELGVDREFGRGRISAYLFDERVRDLLLTTFDGGVPLVRNDGGAEARGFGVTLSRRFGSLADGSVSYAFGHARHEAAASRIPAAFEAAVFHDVVARIETVIDWSDTRVAAYYRLNAMTDDDWHPRATGASRSTVSRFDVQVRQGLPFLEPLTRADWELLLAVRNMFYEASQGDLLSEVAVQEPPTRVVGGISVRF